jgi:hypothetical protein
MCFSNSWASWPWKHGTTYDLSWLCDGCCGRHIEHNSFFKVRIEYILCKYAMK